MLELPEAHRRTIRHAILSNPDYGSVAAFERAAGFPIGDCRVILRGTAAFSLGYFQRFLDEVRALLGLDFPPPVPSDGDCLSRLEQLSHITPAEAEAGRLFRHLSEGWEFPGLYLSRGLWRVWPAPMQALWLALRQADARTNAFRPPLPTCVNTVWNIAVLNDRPALLGIWPRMESAKLEMMSLRIGLKALAARIAEGLPEPDAPPAPDYDLAAEDRAQRAAHLASIALAVRLLEDGNLTRRQIASATGVSDHTVKTLKAVRRRTPEAIARIIAGELSVYQAGIDCGAEKPQPKSDGTARIGAPPIWPPKSAASLKTFRNVQLRDPELAARVERQEISIYAAGLACGYLKPPKPKKRTAA